MSCRRLSSFPLLFLFLLLSLAAAANAEQVNSNNDNDNAESGPKVVIDQVLLLGPLPAGLADASAKRGEIERALISHSMRGASPAVGATVRVFGQAMEWLAADPAELDNDRNGLWLAAFNLRAERFVSGKLEVGGLNSPKLWREGVAQTAEGGSFAMHLNTGSHPMLLLFRGAVENDQIELAWQGRGEHDQVAVDTAPERSVSARLLTNAETVTSMAMSADGRYLALAFDGRDDSAEVDLNRLEIRNLESGRTIRHWPASRPHSLAWSPDGRWLGFRDGNSLWLIDWADGDARPLLLNHEHIGQWRWHPDSRSILFLWTEPYKDDNARTRRLRALEDRWTTFRDSSQLYQVDVDSGLIRPLTDGELSVRLHDIDPEGQRVLISERIIDYAEPPHVKFSLDELYLESLERRTIGQYRLLNDALFADTGFWLLAGPGLPEGDGSTLEGDLVDNEYDGQLYLLDPDGASARSRSRRFDPAIGAIQRLDNGQLLLTVTEGEYQYLYRYDPARERFERLDAGLDIVESVVASRGQRPQVAVRGTEVAAPQRVHLLDLRRNRHQVLVDSRRHYRDVELGEVRTWRFTNRHGDEIDGRYYLPPNFDPERKYPVIVYYYGGTTPVGRHFTGRYPFHLWAAHDYVVYVLQPRGTIGYGQEHSALHVNAWGEHAADDIIEGAQAFAAGHTFVDGERMANIGASYGGFMTMYVATKTDLFAAAISHAGISALTSYWGQGWWGYAYSGIASRDSFPWNNRDLYVGQSPVYSADRITTPLLLLTGDSDTNVPPGESHNMFTALKLLGREVELVEVPGEDHWILDREKRYVWWDTMLAWFDRYLKDQPEWWYQLYPASKPAD